MSRAGEKLSVYSGDIFLNVSAVMILHPGNQFPVVRVSLSEWNEVRNGAGRLIILYFDVHFNIEIHFQMQI